MCSVIKVRAMINAGHLARRASKHLWLPSIEMGVKVDDRDWPVGTVDRTEERKSNCVISTKSDDSGKCLSILCRPFLLGIGRRRAGQNSIVTFFNLM